MNYILFREEKWEYYLSIIKKFARIVAVLLALIMEAQVLIHIIIVQGMKVEWIGMKAQELVLSLPALIRRRVNRAVADCWRAPVSL